MAGWEESLDRGAGDLLGRRLLVGEREVGREGLYRQVVLLGVSVLEWEHRTGIGGCGRTNHAWGDSIGSSRGRDAEWRRWELTGAT